MNINATFLIQIINFLITYYVLNSLLFKPVVNSLKKKKEAQDKLNNSIQKEEEKLLALEKKKSEEVVAFQTHVKTSYPFIQPAITEKHLEIARITPEKIDTDKLKKEVVDVLVKGVPHGY